MYAVVESGGKQYRVSQGDVIYVETLPTEAGKNVALDRVLMIVDDDGNIQVGNPTIEGARVKATIQKHGRGKKIIVYKHRKNYRRKQGHRQNYTSLLIHGVMGEDDDLETPVIMPEVIAEPVDDDIVDESVAESVAVAAETDAEASTPEPVAAAAEEVSEPAAEVEAAEAAPEPVAAAEEVSEPVAEVEETPAPVEDDKDEDNNDDDSVDKEKKDGA